ncbi:DUF4336 domain-containing protein [Vulgatibacter sp.]|uniref:DUF4336 domain-containing protein n=1 Tax=Vulgatibacter sp. TaxID=1971226 RepID=UPI003568CBBF
MNELARGLWIHDAPFSLFGLQLGARMTVVELPGRGLLLHAPVQLDEGTEQQLRALGEVRHLVAPNLLHHLFLPDAARRFAGARLHGPPGIERKHPALTFELLGEAPDPAWAGVIDQQRIEGIPALRETVFLHRPSRTLVCTDLVFHFRQARGLLTRLYLRLNGALGGVKQTGLLRSAVKDRAAARRSLDRVLAWDFDRVVMAHGEVLERGGKEALRDATAWL